MELTDMIKAAKESQNDAKTIEENAKIGLMINQATRGLENTVTDISTNQSNLSSFAFELRKADSEDKYSFDLLYG